MKFINFYHINDLIYVKIYYYLCSQSFVVH